VSATKDARQAFRQDVDELSRKIIESLSEALETEKEYSKRVRCRKCSTTEDVIFRVPDASGRVNAAKLLLEQGWVKPGSAAPEVSLEGALGAPAEELSGDERRAILNHDLVREFLEWRKRRAEQPVDATPLVSHIVSVLKGVPGGEVDEQAAEGDAGERVRGREEEGDDGQVPVERQGAHPVGAEFRAVRDAGGEEEDRRGRQAGGNREREGEVNADLG
jgi:hypothetical protein